MSLNSSALQVPNGAGGGAGGADNVVGETTGPSCL